MATATAYPHIELDQSGMPYVRGTRTKVIEIVLDRLAHHWDADEIRRQHPHLTLAQIYNALAYYHEPEAEIDRLIEERAARAADILARLPASPLRAKLQAAKRQRGRA
jgi:uncharacterized protein (DUF433 family)